MRNDCHVTDNMLKLANSFRANYILASLDKVHSISSLPIISLIPALKEASDLGGIILQGFLGFPFFENDNSCHFSFKSPS